MTYKISKLGYVVPEFPSQTHIFFWREITALRSFNVDVQIISTKPGDLNKIKHDFARNAKEECHYVFPPSIFGLLKFFTSPRWLMKCIKYSLSLNSSLKEKLRTIAIIPSAADTLHFCKKNNISHIHGHSCANVAHMLAMVSLDKSIKYSLTLHGGLKTYGTCHKEKMANATFISTVTKPLQLEIIQEVGIPADKIPVIWMGVDLKKFNHKTYSKTTSEPLRLITVARLDQGKGHHYSLEALAHLRDEGHIFTYDIIGGGNYESQIIKKIATLNLEKHVKIHGSLSENQVKELLSQSDIFLLTSAGVFEAAPVSVMEAMAIGLPVICSKIGGTPDMVTEGYDGYLTEQRNVEDIYKAIMIFFNNIELCEIMGRQAHKTASEKFSHLIQAKKLLDAIKSSHINY